MQDAPQDDFPLNAADHALAQASTATDLDTTDLSNCWQMLPVGQGVAQAANAEVLVAVLQEGGNGDGEEEGSNEEAEDAVMGEGGEGEGQGGEEGEGHGGEASRRKQKRQKVSPEDVRSHIEKMQFVPRPKTGRPPNQKDPQPTRHICIRCNKEYKKSDRLDYHFFKRYMFRVSDCFYKMFTIQLTCCRLVAVGADVLAELQVGYCRC